MPDTDAGGVNVEAQRDVLVTATPLGDEVTGTLEQGQAATAVCFVKEATTNAGVNGSAVKIEGSNVSGYAAVTSFPEDPADRRTMFDIAENVLQDRLPTCKE